MTGHAQFEYKQERLDALKEQLLTREGQPYYPLASSLAKSLKADYYARSKANAQFFKELQEAYGSKLEDMADFDQLWNGPLPQALALIFGEERGAELTELLRRRVLLTYSTSTAYRKGYRSTKPSHYTAVILAMIESYYDYCGYDFTLEQYLTLRAENLPSCPVISDRIALELDRNNEQVLELLRDILFGDNQGALLNRVMIRGIVRSHHVEAHRMLGQLLAAAKLQEGLRQSILESLDEGTAEAAVCLIEVVLEHNLERFSSVIRAMDTWTGLAYTDQKPEVVSKGLKLGLRALTDANYREEAEQSSNALEYYFVLWAEATYDVNKALAHIRRVLQEGARYKKLTALYFLAQLDQADVRHQLAAEYLPHATDDLEQVAWLMNSFYYLHSLSYSYRERQEFDLSGSPISGDAAERRTQFDALYQVLRNLKGVKTFSESVFPWAGATLQPEELLIRMMTLAAYDNNKEMIDQLIGCKEQMSSAQRQSLLVHLVELEPEGKQREFLFDTLGDRSISNREAALERLKQLKLSAEELDHVTALLKLKTGSLRQTAIQLLTGQEDGELLRAAGALFKASNAQQRLAGLSIAEALQQDDKRQQLAGQLRELVVKLNEQSKATAQEQVLIDKLLQESGEDEDEGSGFGIYDAKAAVAIPPQYCHPETGGRTDAEWDAYAAEVVKQFTAWKVEDVTAIYDHIEALIKENYNYEYEGVYYSGYCEKMLLGDSGYRMAREKREDGEAGDESLLDSYPLPDVWRKAARELKLTPMPMLALLLGGLDHTRSYMEESPWYTELYADIRDQDKIRRLNAYLDKELKHVHKVNQIVRLLLREIEPEQCFKICLTMYRALRARMTAEQCRTDWQTYRDNDGSTRFYSDSYEPALASGDVEQWLQKANELMQSDEQFEAYFYTAYASYQMLSGNETATLDLDDLLRAHKLGLIGDDLLMKEMMQGRLSHDLISRLTNPAWSKKYWEDYPAARPLLERIVKRIVEIEARRGDMPTAVSRAASLIRHFEGMRYFVDLLTGLGKETFQRGYVYSTDQTKKTVLSSLLKACCPATGEDAALLGELLASTKVAEERLLEAAMYAPQWVDIVQEHLGWTGLKSAAWYFHAHVNESFSAQKETEVAIFSPISPQSFNDGAFDGQWFKSAYETLGAERFDLLYKCAKYITDGGNSHRRAQLFADATLGKLDKKELTKEIGAARNKDKLLSYSLLPMAAGDKREALERYEFIQQFLKESKQFGAQRRESEAKAGRIALENLARNSGYSDVNRMTWDLEAEKIGEVAIYFTPQEVNGVKLWLQIGEDGEVDLLAEKGGKQLKSVPAAIRKDELVLNMKEIQKELKNQYSRAKKSFEQAMEDEIRFTAAELQAITRNPVIAPLVHDLVWIAVSADARPIGYLQRSGEKADGFLLRLPDGQVQELEGDTELQLAHPVHLYASGRWSDFQRDLFERQIKQPFKQVFREYYRLNSDEEAAGTLSRRYAGHQVQPKRTVALLRGRTWTVDYEDGLQKVYYKENLIARMYAMADWFSPADIEPPTLETVEFFGRETRQAVKLADVPPIIFSEVMRDIDLVVSVAHAGGVDPEASHSTVEMRAAIAKELLALLKVDNIRLEGSHAHITGKLGEYSVHLGSGIVHKKGTGALNILPVHSQSRGRLFLPFVDSDPRTAEIMSKLLLLAEDHKIKDPTILANM